MSKAKFEAARELIQAKQYDEARILLKTIDHPKAAEWIAKINALSPPGTAMVANEPAPVQPPRKPKKRGHPKTGEATVSVVVETNAQATVQMKVVCPYPKCEAQNVQDISILQSDHLLTCPTCGRSYDAQVVKIRAKRARGNRRENRRDFTIRVIEFSGRERVIEFARKGYDDFELRSGDVALFAYIEGNIKIVQNMTTRQYMSVEPPGCYIATYLYGRDSAEVAALRDFRDHVLIQSFVLSRFVRLYYFLSPKTIALWGDNKAFRLICLIVVDPIAKMLIQQNRR